MTYKIAVPDGLALTPELLDDINRLATGRQRCLPSEFLSQLNLILVAYAAAPNKRALRHWPELIRGFRLAEGRYLLVADLVKVCQDDATLEWLERTYSLRGYQQVVRQEAEKLLQALAQLYPAGEE